MIKAIAEKAKEKHNLKIRLLILDHVKPTNMLDDIAYGRATGGIRSGGTSYEFRGFEHSTINLAPDKNSSKLLSKIISRVAMLFSANVEDQPNDAIIQKATDVLLTMGEENTAKSSDRNKTRSNSTHHPLFAALIGQALGLNPGDDVTELKRRDLIDQYFKPAQRIPWKKSDRNAYWNNLGAWIGCYVSVATLLRGAEFDHLHKYLPTKFDGKLKKPEAADIISQISGRLVANEDRHFLKPFEPDVLGETFFLKFLHECRHYDDVMDEFYKMLGTFETPQHEDEAVSNFLETIQRLVRNLINEDQKSDFSEDAWKNLGRFLNPDNFAENGLMRQAISIALGDTIGQLNKAEFKKEVIQSIADNVMVEYLDDLSSGYLWEYAYSATAEYLEWKLQAGYSKEKIIEKLKRIIEQSVTKFDDGATAFMLASQNNHFEIAQLLIANKADINLTNSYGLTAFMLASQNSHIEIAQLLIDNNADINQAQTDGTTTLMWASRYNQIEIAQLLIDNNADINQATTNGTTALVVASLNNHTEITQLLIDNKVDINQVTNDTGFTALTFAAGKGYVDVLSVLISHPEINIDSQMNLGITALGFAAALNRESSVKLLIDAGTNPTIETVGGLTAADLALMDADNQELHDFLKQAEIDWIAKHGLS